MTLESIVKEFGETMLVGFELKDVYSTEELDPDKPFTVQIENMPVKVTAFDYNGEQKEFLIELVFNKRLCYMGKEVTCEPIHVES